MKSLDCTASSAKQERSHAGELHQSSHQVFKNCRAPGVRKSNLEMSKSRNDGVIYRQQSHLLITGPAHASYLCPLVLTLLP